MKTFKKNIIGLVAAVIVTQLIDFIWYSGMLVWQPAVEHDFPITVFKDVILAIASFYIYDTFYEGSDLSDVFEFSFIFTLMHVVLDDKPMVFTYAEMIATLILMSHSIIILFSTIFVVHYVKALTSPSKR